MASWPSGVPQSFDFSGFNYSAKSGVIRTEMDTGPDKIRRRYTATTKNMKGIIVMTKSQFETWESWFENTIAYGALPFNIAHPISGVSVEVRMVISKSGDAYSVKQRGESTDVILSIEVEKLP